MATTGPRHSPGYRCTGAQASCGCGWRGPVHKGSDRHKRARADLMAHVATYKGSKA